MPAPWTLGNEWWKVLEQIVVPQNASISLMPSTLGERVRHYIHNIGDGKFDSVEDDHTVVHSNHQAEKAIDLFEYAEPLWDVSGYLT